MNKFENKDGQLSQYALICGYIQEARTDTKHVMLFEDGEYVVKAWDINNPYNRIAWECFEHLTDARTYYKELLK